VQLLAEIFFFSDEGVAFPLALVPNLRPADEAIETLGEFFSLFEFY